MSAPSPVVLPAERRTTGAGVALTDFLGVEKYSNFKHNFGTLYLQNIIFPFDKVLVNTTHKIIDLT
jgi:hypothetical protein